MGQFKSGKIQDRRVATCRFLRDLLTAHLHILITLSFLAGLLTFSSSALAQLVGSDTAAGSSCAGFPQGATRMTADPDFNGRQVVLTCNGTTWQALGADAAGTDRQLQFNSAGALSATSSLVYSSTGNLGVGTSSPASRVDVVGQIRIDDSSGIGSQGCFRYNGTTAKVEYSNDCSNWLSFSSPVWTLGSNDDIYYDTGTTPRVGIGTTNPSYLLDVDGTIRTTASLVINPTPGAATPTFMSLGTLGGVSLNSLNADDVLQFNGTNWVNVPEASIGGAGTFNNQIFTASGTWTKPAGVNVCDIELWGGGGGGGGASSTSGTRGGGGGGGAYLKISALASSLNATESVTVGAGGTAGGATGTSGGAGGSTSFASYIVYGGGGGSGRTINGDTGGGGVGGVLGAGQTLVQNSAGPGSGGLPYVSGGYGEYGGGRGGITIGDESFGYSSVYGGGGGGGYNPGGDPNGNGGNSVYGGGGGGAPTSSASMSGGTSLYGGSGGASGSNSAGVAGSAPGGGGGGASNTASTGRAGGAGARGEVRVRCW